MTGEFNDSQSSQVLFAKEKFKNSTFGTNLQHKNLVFNNCRIIGTLSLIVLSWRTNRNQIVYVAIVAVFQEDDDIVLSITNGSFSIKDKWILDCGCSCHISFGSKLFSTDTPFKVEIIWRIIPHNEK